MRRCQWGANEDRTLSLCPENYPRWGVQPPQWTSQLPSHAPSGRRAPSLPKQSHAVIASQGVIWLASSGVTSREVSSEKSAGSQYWASPAACASSQARPSFSRWSWIYETGLYSVSGHFVSLYLRLQMQFNAGFHSNIICNYRPLFFSIILSITIFVGLQIGIIFLIH